MKHGAKKIWKNIGIVVVCLCIFSYSVFHISSLFAEEIGTIVVGPTTERTTTKLSGYIFRDAELVYPKNYNGAVDYLVQNGEKVSAKSDLATVYSEGNSADIKDLLAVIDEQIALLRGTTDDVPPVSKLTSLRKSASDAYYSIMKQMSSGAGLTIDANKKKLLVSLNSIATLTDEDFKIRETLNELEKIRAEMLSAGGDSEKISTDRSGYFYTTVDGYEDTFSGIAAEKLTRSELLELFENPVSDSSSAESIGKMSYDSTWYFAAEIDADAVEKFSEGEKYLVEFTSGGYFEIDMTVYRLLVDEGEDSAVIVFRSNVLPENFNFRRQTANVITSSVSGIYVPKSAVHRENFERVVYILKGSVVKLRHVEVIYDGADYYIVKENPETEDDKIYLKSNEQLIVRGSNLFDGRILG